MHNFWPEHEIEIILENILENVVNNFWLQRISKVTLVNIRKYMNNQALVKHSHTLVFTYPQFK